MKSLHAAVEIDAPAERVWQVVSDFARYCDWNPFIVRSAGEPRVGERLDITIAAPRMKPVSFRPRVPDVERGRLIRWKGEFKAPRPVRRTPRADRRPAGRRALTLHDPRGRDRHPASVRQQGAGGVPTGLRSDGSRGQGARRSL